MTSPSSVALITGAGSGIGRALAKTLAHDGYAIAAVDVNDEGLRSLANEFAQTQQRFAWCVADVTDPASLKLAVRDLEAKLGPTVLLVANAGIGTETSGLNYDIEAMNRVISVNLIGVSNSIGVVLPGMIERKRGHLVAISSAASYRGLPRMLAYCASKSGVNAIMDGLRVELAGCGIDVTTICPGWIRTPLLDQLEGKFDNLLEIDAAVREIHDAIRRKQAFHCFPRKMRWRLRLLTMMPRSWQDAYIRKKMNEIQTKNGTSTAQPRSDSNPH